MKARLRYSNKSRKIGLFLGLQKKLIRCSGSCIQLNNLHSISLTSEHKRLFLGDMETRNS